MTLEQAVAILNERKHREESEWCHYDGYVTGKDRYDALEPFEAIAIAEKYAGGWISVEERLPEEWVSVLAYGTYSEANNLCAVVASYATNVSDPWTDLQGDTFIATHWQPLPEPPTKT